MAYKEKVAVTLEAKTKEWSDSLKSFFNAASRDRAEVAFGKLYDHYDQDVSKVAKIEFPVKGARLESLKKAMLFQFWAEKKPNLILPKLTGHIKNSIKAKSFDESTLSALAYLKRPIKIDEIQREDILTVVRALLKAVNQIQEKSAIQNSLMVEGLITLNYFSNAKEESEFYLSLANQFPEDYILQLFQQFGNQGNWDEVPQDIKDSYCNEFVNFVTKKLDDSILSDGLELAIPYLLEAMEKLAFSNLNEFQKVLRKYNISDELPVPLPPLP